MNIRTVVSTSSIALLVACSSTSHKFEEIVVTGFRKSAQSVAAADTNDDAYQTAKYRNNFEKIEPNPVKLVSKDPVSTLSADVDTASYSFVRSRLNNGYLPTKAAVRLEEMVNYFDYRYPKPESVETPFEATLIVHDSPWAQGRKLIHIGIQGYTLNPKKQPDSNLVFLLDISGSMNQPNKLPLVKKSMNLLLNQLKPTDTVSIAVYAGAAGTVLEPTPVAQKNKIRDALNKLSAGGSTAGGEGIELAYRLAEENFDKNAINRIILATDGDFNVGIYDREQLKEFVERKRNQGIYLSVLGFGQGNYQDHMMQSLAQNGNGIAAYIDTLGEAQKVLVHEATSSLFPIANDLKLQVEFNPNAVKEYRLLGYETRHLERENFNNDNVDAGDIGSGHSVTAIYEVTLLDSKNPFIDNLHYQNTVQNIATAKTRELAYLKMRYKRPGETTSRLIQQAIIESHQKTYRDTILEQDVNFATAVAGFAQLLKDGKYIEKWTLEDAMKLALDNRGSDEFGYRSELVQLIRKAKTAEEADF